MTAKRDDLTDVPEGEDVGDISSGFGNPDAHPHVSDEKAEAMLAARPHPEARKVVDRPADNAGGDSGNGAKSW